MKKIKTLLIFSLVIALSFSLFGCKLLPWGNSAAEETATIAALPQWLTLAHRAEAAEEPEVLEEEEAAEEETVAVPAQTGSTQPATTQPAQQPAQSSSTPRWQQPGTMEYISKIQLDEKYTQYNRLKIRLNNADTKDKEGIKQEIATLLSDMLAIASGIGLDLDKEYGLKVTTGGSDWLNNWDESPSGFGDSGFGN